MRDLFHRQLDVLVLQLAHMCDLTAIAIRKATDALLDNDLQLAEQVIADDHVLDEARDRVEHDVQLLLALQSPVCGDLRTILAVALSVERVERMGDLAEHVALAVRRSHPDPVLPAPLRARFEQMATIATRSAVTAGWAVRGSNPVLCRELDTLDHEVNDLHRSLFAVLSCAEWRHGVTAGVEAALLSRYYERFADHAVSVARRISTAYSSNSASTSSASVLPSAASLRSSSRSPRSPASSTS
ncbi:phosphate signaling complex PhoU family protein [Lentzea cavernae]|uniref:Phosphate transport system regulatory protein PhoU n=1 Tax=Lentzea cavernae TaxID=2020703 RepID=A0ABQ3M3E3_9PSEU|nr:PhoU domain-containing protein [Lentzea cavernae]GHH32638.1 phosphate transport system regulatory protein PhoU [Lentzea cavernae]